MNFLFFSNTYVTMILIIKNKVKLIKSFNNVLGYISNVPISSWENIRERALTLILIKSKMIFLKNIIFNT